MTGEQARWGLENLALDQKKLDALGFAGVMRPLSTSCADHMGANWARVHTWDGSEVELRSDWLQADEQIHQADGEGGKYADKYAHGEKKTPAIRARAPQDCLGG